MPTGVWRPPCLEQHALACTVPPGLSSFSAPLTTTLPQTNGPLVPLRAPSATYPQLDWHLFREAVPGAPLLSAPCLSPALHFSKSSTTSLVPLYCLSLHGSPERVGLRSKVFVTYEPEAWHSVNYLNRFSGDWSRGDWLCRGLRSVVQLAPCCSNPEKGRFGGDRQRTQCKLVYLPKREGSWALSWAGSGMSSLALQLDFQSHRSAVP